MIRSILSLTRAGNLAIICLIFLAIRHTIIQPILAIEGTVSHLENLTYTLLMLSTVLIAAGGYVINDIFDVRVDELNKPGKNYVGKSVSLFSARALYVTLTASGIVASYFFGELAGIRYPILVFMLSAGLLYFYSSSYKPMFLAGNVVISALAGLTVMLPMIFDKHALQSEAIITLSVAYATFAFAMTLIREIIKDCEDAEGDAITGGSTMAVVLGASVTRKIAAFLTLITFAGILWIQIVQQQWQSIIPFVYVSLFIQLPLLWLMYKCFTAKNKNNDHHNSLLAKMIMLTGIFSMAIFHFSF